MLVRKTQLEDVDDIERIFKIARRYMAAEGNESQWGNDRPHIQLVLDDIDNGNSYVIINDDKVVGTFACIKGLEPTYIDIDGKWLNDDEYVTIHRIASDGTVKGIFDTAIKFAKGFNLDIRIDTHHNNKTMRHLIEKSGFKECGIIIVDDGSPRIAYQLVKNI